MQVKPRDGFKIYDPDRRDYLPPEGRRVPDGHLYWARQLRTGDVVRMAELPPDQPVAEAAAEAPAASVADEAGPPSARPPKPTKEVAPAAADAD